jgi:hypothetical protein
MQSIAIKCADTLAERCLYGELHKSALKQFGLLALYFNTRLVDHKSKQVILAGNE